LRRIGFAPCHLPLGILIADWFWRHHVPAGAAKCPVVLEATTDADLSKYCAFGVEPLDGVHSVIRRAEQFPIVVQKHQQDSRSGGTAGQLQNKVLPPINWCSRSGIPTVGHCERSAVRANVSGQWAQQLEPGWPRCDPFRL